MTRLLCTAAAILLFGARVTAQEVQKSPDPRYATAFDTVWRDVNDNFYDPSLLGVNWIAVGARYKSKLSDIHDDSSFMKVVDQMLHELPTSHLHFRVSATSGKTIPTTGIGVLTRKIDDRDIVVSADPASDASRKGIRAGDTLKTDPAHLHGPWGSETEVEVEHCDNRTQTLIIDREPFDWPFERPSVQWKVIERSPTIKFGYVRITHFEDDVAPLTDEAMEELANTTGIVIDLRNNTGGNASYIRLMSYISPTPRAAFILLSRPFLNRFGRAPDKLNAATLARIPRVTGAYTTSAIVGGFRTNGGGAAYYTEKVAHLYTGKIVLLVNKETASAAEAFAWDIKGWPRVTVVGQPTAGAIVGAEDFDIPGGWTLTLPTHAAWGADGRIFRDELTRPDVFVPETRESLCQGQDLALQAALDLVLK